MRFDFKGNLAEYSRAIVTDAEALPDWSAGAATDAALTSETVYDALSRAIHETTPDGSTIHRTYNVAGQLESVDVNVRGEANATPVILATDYDAKGRRTRIQLGARASPTDEPVTTEYDYDLLTARLTRIVTRRDPQQFASDCPQPPPPGWPGCRIQSLSYTYDAVGNVTHVRDDAQQRIFFANRRVEPSCEYTHDALYRLIGATGREHVGQPGAGAAPSYSDSPRARIPHPADGTAVATYTEKYAYDDAGNLTTLDHAGTDARAPGYTREFRYEETSPLEPGGNNRLTRSVLGGAAGNETFSTAGDGYDRHGNLLHMPHLAAMAWDFRDRLRTTQRQAMGPGDTEGIATAGERTFHVYGADGRRVRKTTRLVAGGLKDERIYIGIYERYRRTGVNAVERETLRIGDGTQTVALIETRVAGNEPGVPARMIRIQLGNHLGSAALELGADAAVISYEEYTPYGGTSYQGVASQLDAPRRYRFCGKERDEETGLYHFGGRYYAPWLARWISCDSEDASNRYLYVSANPVNLVDPDGRNGGPPPLVTGSYGGAGGIGGDHVHQVAAMTQSTAAGRTSAPLFNQALSVSTSQNPGYLDVNGQRLEQAFNRSMWGRDYAGTPAPNGRVTLVSSGNTTVGSSAAANPSPWAEDVKSFFKLREAGVDRNTAVDAVSRSRDQLDQAGATTQRVPQGPRNAPAALKTGQNVAVQQPVRLSGEPAGSGGNPAASTTTTATTEAAAGGSSTASSAANAADDVLSVVDDVKPAAGTAAETLGTGGKILKGIGGGAAVLGSLVGGVQVGTGIVQIQEGQGAEGAVTITEGGANLALTIGGAALVKAKVVTTTAGVTGGAATVGAGVLAAGGVALAAEEWRRAIRGQKSAAREAAEYWADVAVGGEAQGGFEGAAKQAAGWTFGFFATLIAVGQGQGPR